MPANIIVDSARRALTEYDVYTSMVKSWVFGTIVSTVRGVERRRDWDEGGCCMCMHVGKEWGAPAGFYWFVGGDIQACTFLLGWSS